MSKQLHKNFTNGQVKSLLKSYLDKEIKISYILQILKIKRSRFFELLTRYRKDPNNFSIQYKKNTSNYRIDREIEANIIKEHNSIKIIRNYDKRFHERLNNNLEQKRIVPELSQKFVQSGDTIFLDTSTTCYEFARTLALSSHNLHIITNNIYMAVELMNIYKIDLVLVGGNIRQGYFSTVGPLAENMLANINVDKFFFSCTMLNEKGIYESNILEGNIKVKMFENSRFHYLLVGSSKFDKASIFRTTGIENLDAIITDKPLPNKYLDILKNKNVQIVIPS